MKKKETYIGGKSNAFVLDINNNNKEEDQMFINEINIPKEKEAEIKSSVISQLKTEISSLKEYIKKMNIQIRKNFNLEIQLSLEEGFVEITKKIKSGEKDQEALQDLIRDWMNKLFNMDYINPLIILYENYIKNLENEIKNYENINKKNENIIMKLIGENNELRDRILATEEEMKNFIEIRNQMSDGSSIIIMDRDHVMKVEERNKLLSKENEILVVNYNKIQNELLQLKNENQIFGNEERNLKYQKLNGEFIKMKNNNEELIEQRDIINKKMMEMSNVRNNLEIDNLKLKEVISKMNYELNSYKEANERYENLLKNNNEINIVYKNNISKEE
jgi:hypothetical protein